MSTVEIFIKNYEFNRQRTLGLLKHVEEQPDPQTALAWRPAPGRAHIGWQLLHIALTEELFASERLAPHKTPQWGDLLPRFRGGSTPDDDVPRAATIRQILAESRHHLLATLQDFGDDRLAEIPPSLAERKINVETVLHIINWHESHHHGQAHITLNLFKNRPA